MVGFNNQSVKTKYFIITIDTEGDNLWNIRPYPKPLSRITVHNGEYVERFQILCEKFGFIPTYLVNYEMSKCHAFIDMIKNHSKNLEIGMHMHAFNTPPHFELANRFGRNKSYLGEYPFEIMREKTKFITEQLQNTFKREITSHRGGRWYLDRNCVSLLREFSYIVDCTVTPEVDWRENSGQTGGSCGIDYRKAPKKAYVISENNVCHAGNSGLIEVPMTIRGASIVERLKNFDLWERKKAKTTWLRPTGNNLTSMMTLIKEVYKEETDYIEFMLHSSELMPNGSPTFPNKRSIEKLYSDLEELFKYICYLGLEGVGISDYAWKKEFDR